MKLVFLGSGAPFGSTSLEALVRGGYAPVLVVTGPPRRRRRRGATEPTPVQVTADEASIEVLTPEKVNRAEVLDALRAPRADLFVVAEYGQILGDDLLAIPPLGSINVHTSLLPRHRGASPVVAAILAGDTETGITIQRVVKRLDAGPVLAQRRVAIEPAENAGELSARMAPLAAELLLEVVQAFAEGNPPPDREQDEDKATVCRRLTKEQGVIDWSAGAERVALHVRAMTPKPGASTTLRDLPLLIRRGEALTGKGEPGVVVGRDEFVVGCGEGLYRVLELVPAGRRPMSARDFLNGYQVSAGECLR